MATVQIATFAGPHRITDKRWAATDTNTLSSTLKVAAASQNTLDARLSALGYTANQIQALNLNDKIYHVRMADDPTSF